MADAHDPVAFKEKLRTISFGFGGRSGAGNRRDFHELPSVAQRERDHVRELKAAGIEFERARS